MGSCTSGSTTAPAIFADHRSMLETPTEPRWLDIADMTGDGLVDIVVQTRFTMTIIRESGRTGSFDEAMSWRVISEMNIDFDAPGHRARMTISTSP